MEERSLLSRGSSDRQTSHLQRITGTPIDVPVPRNVIASIPEKQNRLQMSQVFFCIRTSIEKISRHLYIITLCPQRCDRYESGTLLLSSLLTGIWHPASRSSLGKRARGNLLFSAH